MRLIGLTLALLLVLAAPARAGWKIDRALAVAQIVWHPACGQLRVSFERPPADVAEAAGWAWSGDCTIRVNSQGSHRAFEPFCQTVLHEAGHVAGMGHSSNPRSVMYPYRRLDVGHTVLHGRRVTVWPGVDSRCRDRGRPFLGAHGATSLLKRP